MVGPASHKVPRAPWYSGSWQPQPPLSSTGLSPSLANLSSVLRLARPGRCDSAAVESPSASYPPLATPAGYSTSWVWAPPLSLATTQGILSLPAGTKMFQFPACPANPYSFQCWLPALQASGFPHSDIPGSSSAHDLPRLFAVYRVLRRLLMPRHPPNALLSFFLCDTEILTLLSLVNVLPG